MIPPIEPPAPMDTLIDTTARISEIESRQDDALAQLADLERRIEQVLAEFIPPAIQAASSGPSSPAVQANAKSSAIKAA